MFYWPAFFDSFPVLLPGLLVTVELTVLVMPCALVVALALALARLYAPAVVAKMATGWVEFWRATPLLLQLYWLYYVLPSETNIQLPGFATVAFGLVATCLPFCRRIFVLGSRRSGSVNGMRGARWACRRHRHSSA
jgi:His/Glu/Gln/Arg/opine family amino acid ABC transporter permease subunit